MLFSCFYLRVIFLRSLPRSYVAGVIKLRIVPRSWNISQVPKADCMHMSAVVCGCMCGLFTLLLQCINGVFGFSCHLCVYPFCCQIVCFCACAHLNHCNLYMLKTRPSGSAVIFSQLHRLQSLRHTANALSQTQKGPVWRNGDRRVSITGSSNLIARVVDNLQWDANQAFHMQN